MSMRNEVTQGSIISNIRSQKYLKVSCFGIVISARCDIAQNKVELYQQFHCPSGLKQLFFKRHFLYQ